MTTLGWPHNTRFEPVRRPEWLRPYEGWWVAIADDCHVAAHARTSSQLFRTCVWLRSRGYLDGSVTFQYVMPPQDSYLVPSPL